MEVFWFFLLCAVCVGYAIIKAINEAELLNKNPEAWAAKKLVEEEVKRRKRESQASIGMAIARMFLPK